MAKKKEKITNEEVDDKNTETKAGKQDQDKEENGAVTAEDKVDEQQEEPAGEKKSKEEELQEKLDEINDKYLRMYSEFDNYRRRTINERIELSKTASAEVITELLPVLDDFERAIKSSEEVKDCETVKEGMQLIYNKMNSTLQKKG
ncbi:MAG: nucleotide exchange factor GrpE [Bacteroidales bacterium]|nr:nucleotide exchange factor GrpE [Bacteroidales bacterium]